jgi:hypothetical protein
VSAASFENRRWTRITAALVAGVAVMHSAAFAQTDLAAKRELVITGTRGELDILRTVATPTAAVAAVSDAAGVLVVGHKPKVLSSREKKDGVKLTNGPHLSFFRLDAQGEISGPAATVTLPTSPKFAERQNVPLSVVAHPKLPLVYVWQDVQPPGEGVPPDDPKIDDFQHLHVYDVASAEPKLVQSLAGGETYSLGNWAGAIDFDRTASRLFIPNLQRRVTTTFTPSIGYLRLLDDGSVVPNEEEAAAVSVGGKNSTADRTGAVSLAARKAYLEQVRTGKVLERAVRYATSATTTFAGFPSGLGFHNATDDVTIVCGALGPVTWDEANRRAQFNSVVFYPIVGVGYRYRMVGHQTLPVVFFTGTTAGYVYRMEHVDGFLTMLPQRGALPGVVALESPPVLLGKRNQLACGSSQFVHLLGFDDQGRFDGQRTDVLVKSPSVAALAYSARFDRLYVPIVEEKK